MKWDCPHCRKATAMKFIAIKREVQKCYDYQQEVELRVFQCTGCDRYTQRRNTTTTYMALPRAVAEAVLGKDYAAH